MAKTKLTWEEVSQYEEIKGYGQQVWRHEGRYYYVTEEGGIAAQRVVYEFPDDLYQLLLSGTKSLPDIGFKIQSGSWPPTEEERELEKIF